MFLDTTFNTPTSCTIWDFLSQQQTQYSEYFSHTQSLKLLLNQDNILHLPISRQSKSHSQLLESTSEKQILPRASGTDPHNFFDVDLLAAKSFIKQRLVIMFQTVHDLSIISALNPHSPFFFLLFIYNAPSPRSSCPSHQLALPSSLAYEARRRYAVKIYRSMTTPKTNARVFLISFSGFVSASESGL